MLRKHDLTMFLRRISAGNGEGEVRSPALTGQLGYVEHYGGGIGCPLGKATLG
jgi:hypothetical protein